MKTRHAILRPQKFVHRVKFADDVWEIVFVSCRVTEGMSIWLNCRSRVIVGE